MRLTFFCKFLLIVWVLRLNLGIKYVIIKLYIYVKQAIFHFHNERNKIMANFENKICPVCHAPFNDKADIVVCPVCGTPHHRQCWMIKNKCALESLHGRYQWNGHLPDESEPSVVRAEHMQSDNTLGQDVKSDEFKFGSPDDLNAYLENFIKTLDSDEEGIDGVSIHELSAYVGTSVMHYGRAFSLFRSENANGKKPKMFMNFCSGFFAPVFQFYRKMDLLGIAVIFLQVLISLPVVLAATNSGLLTGAYSELMNVLISLGNILSLAQTIVLCLFGDYMYYLRAVKQIKKIRARFSKDDIETVKYYEALEQCGRPSWLRAAIGVLAEALAIALVSILPLLISGQVKVF